MWWDIGRVEVAPTPVLGSGRWNHPETVRKCAKNVLLNT